MKKTERKHLILQLLFVIVVFLLMIISSSNYVRNMLRNHLFREASEILRQTSLKIEAELLEPEAVLISFSEGIRHMILNGYSPEEIQAIMRRIGAELEDKKEGFIYVGNYGYFHVFNGISLFHSSTVPENDLLLPLPDYDYTLTPWYQALAKAQDGIGVTSIYRNLSSGENMITYAREIKDDYGNSLAFICLNVSIEKIIENVANMYLTEGSYGILCDEELTIFYHPINELIGGRASDAGDSFAKVLFDVSEGQNIYEREVRNFNDDLCVVFTGRLNNGWVLLLITPKAEYYREQRNLELILGILGIIFSTALCFILIRVDIARRKTEEKNIGKTQFLANMSHEIRTPMNSIIGFSELAQDNNDINIIKKYLEKITESAKSLLFIINDILDISKIEAGRLEIENISFDLHDILNYCQATIMPIAEDKGLKLHFYTEPDIGKKLLGDPVKLRQALLNLLSNAVKFTNTGIVKLSASIIKKDTNSITINFEVKDSGIGMNSEQILKIFKPFSQADGSITRKYGGTGLGLTITKNLIEMMGGHLHVESRPGIGSKFNFSLSFNIIESFAETNTENNYIFNEDEKPVFSGDVIIFEDNKMNQQVICDHLSRVGLRFKVAENGKEGLEIISKRMEKGEKPFDLIFMDVHMPVMDGLETTAKLLEMGIKTPIIAMTANIMSNEIEIYKDSGMAANLGKPFTSHELWECLIKFLPLDRITKKEKNMQEKIINDEEHMIRKFKLSFLKNNKTVYEELIKAIKEENDMPKAHRIAHSLKGNSGTIGETELQEAAKHAEIILREGNIPDAEILNNLQNKLNIVLEKLNTLFNGEDD